MRFSTRELVYMAIFGAIWGAIEMTLGSYLHVLNVPQTGTILSAVGVAILVGGRSFVPKRGATLLSGIVALFIKMFSLGGIVINPMIAIFMESLLVELGLGAKGISKVRCILAGAMGTSWVIVHPFITQGIMAGWGLARVYIWLVEGGARLLGIPSRYALLVLGLLFAMKPVAGALGGLIGWEMTIAVSKRLGRRTTVDQRMDTPNNIRRGG